MNHSQAIEKKSPMRYVLGELRAADLDEFEEHLADCSNCMNEVWMATSFAANAREVFRAGAGKQARASRFAWLQWRPFPAFAFSAALNVALVAGLSYSMLYVVPTLRRETAELSEAAAIEVVPVRAVVRDASASTQVVKASGKSLVLSFDLPQHYRQYVYSIADAKGGVVLSGEVEDRGNESLNLRVPTGRLAPGGYRTTVAGVNGGQREELAVCLLQVEKP